MKTFRLRPTFSIPFDKDFSDVWSRIQAATESRPQELSGQFRGQQAMISIAEEKRHFWSPWLHLEVRPTDTGDSIYGRFSPHPSIWTGFAFTYLVLAFIALFGLIYGCSQLLLQQAPMGFLIIPACGITSSILWIVAQIGQSLAREEMEFMRHLIQESLKVQT